MASGFSVLQRVGPNVVSFTKSLRRIDPHTLEDADVVYIIDPYMHHLTIATFIKSYQKFISKDKTWKMHEDDIKIYSNEYHVGYVYAMIHDSECSYQFCDTYTNKPISTVYVEGTPEFMVHIIRGTFHDIQHNDLISRNVHDQFNCVVELSHDTPYNDVIIGWYLEGNIVHLKYSASETVYIIRLEKLGG